MDEQIERYLQTYTLQEILESNDITDYDVLEYLLSAGILTLNLPEPV